jgi:hypothetical protein
MWTGHNLRLRANQVGSPAGLTIIVIGGILIALAFAPRRSSKAKFEALGFIGGVFLIGGLMASFGMLKALDSVTSGRNDAIAARRKRPS